MTHVKTHEEYLLEVNFNSINFDSVTDATDKLIWLCRKGSWRVGPSGRSNILLTLSPFRPRDIGSAEWPPTCRWYTRTDLKRIELKINGQMPRVRRRDGLHEWEMEISKSNMHWRMPNALELSAKINGQPGDSIDYSSFRLALVAESVSVASRRATRRLGFLHFLAQVYHFGR